MWQKLVLSRFSGFKDGFVSFFLRKRFCDENELLTAWYMSLWFLFCNRCQCKTTSYRRQLLHGAAYTTLLCHSHSFDTFLWSFQERHMNDTSVSNRWQLYYLFKSLFRPSTNQAPRPRFPGGKWKGIHQRIIDSLPQGAVMRKASPCHGIFMVMPIMPNKETPKRFSWR